jgi:GPI mannosyltransferase 3
MKNRVLVLLVATCVTAWFSYAYFHVDEYFQVLELTRLKLDPAAVPELPWEHAERLRPWLQPLIYFGLAKMLAVVSVKEIFALAFVFRLVTGLSNVLAVILFLRTTLPWLAPRERGVHQSVVTLAGFLPYLFVRTSSESASMAALTIGWSLLLSGTPASTWRVPASTGRLAACGLLFGVAFELRFQTAFSTAGMIAWLFWRGGLRARLLPLFAGIGIAIGMGTLADRWGYGEWEIVPWNYFRANVLEGAAGMFGTDPPFAYFWMLPANLFAPIVLLLLGLMLLAWAREPRHPLTWATFPLFVVHNLIPHKEERFLFPLAIFATGLVTLALRPGGRMGDGVWRRLDTWPVRAPLCIVNFVPMLFLALVAVGWNHHVRFAHYIASHIGDELHASAMPEIELTLPPFHPRIYDVDKADPRELGRRIEAGTARPWLITDRPFLQTGVRALDERAVLVYSELPGDEATRLWLHRWVEAYNAWAKPPLRLLRFRTLYRM